MIDSQSFRRACSKFATGIAIAAVTAPDGKPHGLTVNSFTSVSLAPPLVLICIDYKAKALDYFRQSASFGISVLSEQQQETSNRFASRGEHRFHHTAWHAAKSGAPLIDGSLATFDCEVTQIVEAGDHAIFIGKVKALTFDDGRPLLYFASGYHTVA
jgi:flavin reductase (DIM6/NTAB) family NADH-FMN oxidoreductase RutF